MQAKPKSNSVVTSNIEPLAAGSITITVLGIAAPIVFDVAAHVGKEAFAALNDNGKRAILHGFLQRLSDRAAIGRDKITGQSATPAEKYAAIVALRDHYAAGGVWELAGGGLPPIQRPQLYQAVAMVRGYKPEVVEATYRDKPDEVVRTLLTIPAIAGKYTELCKAVSAPAPDNVKAMFDELDKMAALDAAASTPAPADAKNKGFRKPQ